MLTFERNGKKILKNGKKVKRVNGKKILKNDLKFLCENALIFAGKQFQILTP